MFKWHRKMSIFSILSFIGKVIRFNNQKLPQLPTKNSKNKFRNDKKNSIITENHCHKDVLELLRSRMINFISYRRVSQVH